MHNVNLLYSLVSGCGLSSFQTTGFLQGFKSRDWDTANYFVESYGQVLQLISHGTWQVSTVPINHQPQHITNPSWVRAKFLSVLLLLLRVRALKYSLLCAVKVKQHNVLLLCHWVIQCPDPESLLHCIVMGFSLLSFNTHTHTSLECVLGL